MWRASATSGAGAEALVRSWGAGTPSKKKLRVL
jgi:hypothetical protein